MPATTGCPTVFGAGLVALDLVVSADLDRPVRSWAGGTCGNVLSILSYVGWNSYPIARLNSDSAAARVAADMHRWGVKLDFLHSGPQVSTPIIIQENQVRPDGSRKHRFKWECRRCGSWLPRFSAITRTVVPDVERSMGAVDVFFLDRLSRATLTLAQIASNRGAVVMFEPSGRSDPKLFAEALRLAHVVKYADQRLSDAGGTMGDDTATLLEVQTLGSDGLRFRRKINGRASGWSALSAVDRDDIVDTCGSGDWCTAGLLSRLATNGREGLEASSLERVADALQYGQELAAWNCGFEGARGGMYVEHGPGILDVHLQHGASATREEVSDNGNVSCPACTTLEA
ncbi:PfkB family carbohydrate kinase [Cellulomonas sp. URHB0016]